jgi:hypothetical protein
MTQANLTQQRKQAMQDAIGRLDRALDGGTVKVVIGSAGAVAFKGLWRNEGVSDLCAYRALLASNSPALRRAVMRAEVIAGRAINPQAIAAGTHSHDSGASWHPGH